MKKVLIIGTILLVAVISTACINNIAVQDLNRKALEYMEKGDYTQAIERLKSSIDLEPAVFESHYNLAIAYTNNEDYLNAMEEYKQAHELNPNNVDIYYALATTENNLAIDISNNKVKMSSDKSLYKVKSEDLLTEEKPELTEDEKQYIEELNNSAIENYEKYIELSSDKENIEKAQKQIEIIKNKNLSDKEAK